MARIRTIKPEFWADEKLSLLAPISRLVFLGLISLADDAGRLVDNVKKLDGELFPNTDDTCREALDSLARESRILRYRSDSGQDLIQLTNWARHQRVDKPNPHVLPAPPKRPKTQATVIQEDTPSVAKDSGEPPESVASESREPRAPTVDRGPWTLDPDHGPTTGEVDRGAAPAPTIAVDPEFAAFGPLPLESDADREALNTVLTAVRTAGGSPFGWYREMAVRLDGDMAGHKPLTTRQLGRGLRDYVGNGKHKLASGPSFRQFRRYLDDAAKEPDEAPPRSPSRGRLERGRDALAAYAGGATNGE